MANEFENATMRAVASAYLRHFKKKDGEDGTVISLQLTDDAKLTYRHELWLTGSQFMSEDEAIDRSYAALRQYGFDFKYFAELANAAKQVENGHKYFKMPEGGVRVSFVRSSIRNRKGENVAIRTIKRIGEAESLISKAKVEELETKLKNAAFRAGNEVEAPPSDLPTFDADEQIPF